MGTGVELLFIMSIEISEGMSAMLEGLVPMHQALKDIAPYTRIFSRDGC